jgi:tRNA A37 threonylcarbamoyladenosine dehydratase
MAKYQSLTSENMTLGKGFKGFKASRSIACGVQKVQSFAFNCLRRSKGSKLRVQLPAAFKRLKAARSIACGVQKVQSCAFNCLRRSKGSMLRVQGLTSLAELAELG